MKIKSVQVVGASVRDNYVIGYVINGQKLAEIRLEERFLASQPAAMYIGFSETGEILFTVSATCPVIVEYSYS